MKLTSKVLKEINKPAVRRRLMEVMGVTEFTIFRYIQKNSSKLTKAAPLKVIREVTGWSDSEILEGDPKDLNKRSKGIFEGIHIGNLIKEEVECLGLTQKEFGALIQKNEKTVPDIYSRASMSIDLLIIISKALNKDFINFYYKEEPLKSLRGTEIENLIKLIQKLIDENKLLQSELDLTKDELILTKSLFETQKQNISFAKEIIEQQKSKSLPYNPEFLHV